MSDQNEEEYTMPPWGTAEIQVSPMRTVDMQQASPTRPDVFPQSPPQQEVGFGAISDATAPAAPIVVTTPAVAPVVVQPKQGVSFSAMILIAAGSALIGGVLVWMFAGQPELSTARENPSKRKDHWGPGDQYVHVPPRTPRKGGKKKKKVRK
jgi:hypothetical protein